MFDMASVVQVDFQYATFLLKKGWTIYPEAKLFVQLNHSEVLEEFIHVIVSPLEERIARDFLTLWYVASNFTKTKLTTIISYHHDSSLILIQPQRLIY